MRLASIAVFALLHLVSCFTPRNQKAIPDPTTLALSGRDDGTGGRAKVLRNPLMAVHESVEGQQIGIPINPICIRNRVEEAQGTLAGLSPEKVFVTIYPTEVGSGRAPISVTNFDHFGLQQAAETRKFPIDFSSFPDGKYNIIACTNVAGCGQGQGFPPRTLTDGLGINLKNPGNGSYRFTDSEGIFGSNGYKEFLKQTFETYHDLVGIAMNVWIEQGQLVWPKEPVTVWNGRFLPLAGQKQRIEFTDERAGIPVMHVSYRTADDRLQGKTCFPELEVLVIDISNTGIEFSTSSQGIGSDLDGDGVRESISWPKVGRSGFIIANYRIAAGSDGVPALIAGRSRKPANGHSVAVDHLISLDENKDGFLSMDDPEFKNLGLWLDTNSNGKVDSGEAKSLVESAIESINLTFAQIQEGDVNGNSSLFRTVAKRTGINRHALVASVRLAVTNRK
jgi:hypothetical protein